MNLYDQLRNWLFGESDDEKDDSNTNTGNVHGATATSTRRDLVDAQQFLPDDKTQRKRGDGTWERFDRAHQRWFEVDTHATEFETPSDEIVWKAATTSIDTGINTGIALVKLRIPEKAQVNYTSTKCRASEAYVEAIYCIGRRSDVTVTDIERRSTAYSMYDRDFRYRVGERVEPKNQEYEPSKRECAPGIHFFRTPQEAAQFGSLRLPKRTIKRFESLQEDGVVNLRTFIGAHGDGEDRIRPKVGF